MTRLPWKRSRLLFRWPEALQATVGSTAATKGRVDACDSVLPLKTAQHLPVTKGLLIRAVKPSDQIHGSLQNIKRIVTIGSSTAMHYGTKLRVQF